MSRYRYASSGRSRRSRGETASLAYLDLAAAYARCGQAGTAGEMLEAYERVNGPEPVATRNRERLARGAMDLEFAVADDALPRGLR